MNLPGLVVQHINSGAAVGLCLAKLGRGDEVDCEVVLKHGDVFMRADGYQQCPLNLAACDVLGVQDAAF